MVTTRPPKTIVKPTALGPVANTDTKLLIYGLFQKGRILAQDGVAFGGFCRRHGLYSLTGYWHHRETDLCASISLARYPVS